MAQFLYRKWWFSTSMLAYPRVTCGFHWHQFTLVVFLFEIWSTDMRSCTLHMNWLYWFVLLTFYTVHMNWFFTPSHFHGILLELICTVPSDSIPMHGLLDRPSSVWIPKWSMKKLMPDHLYLLVYTTHEVCVYIYSLYIYINTYVYIYREREMYPP